MSRRHWKKSARLTPIWKPGTAGGQLPPKEAWRQGQGGQERVRSMCPRKGKRLEIPYLAATEVLEEVGETLDNVHVILAIFTGIAEEDLRPRPQPLSRECRGVGGGLRTLFI